MHPWVKRSPNDWNRISRMKHDDERAMTMSQRRSLPAPLARMHRWARARPWLGRFTLANRLLLAMAFLPTGLVKATGQRFTTLPVENPVGFFFEAMYQTGPWWHFIGLSQVAASILLLIPATATLGALLFLPIGLSIFLITYGVGFGNTVYVTAGMLLSAIYLVCWDGDRVWAGASELIGRRPGPALLEGAGVVERTGWGLGGVVGTLLVMTTRGFVPNGWIRGLLLSGAAAVVLVVTGWLLSVRRTP